MHLRFERIQKPSSYSDCNLSSLTWMGKVPDGLLQNEDEGWKLNRTNYYQDGWLATGNIRGIVGVTFTTCRSRKNIINDLPQRTNYNLRGHRSEVTLVKWNEPYQKLASCDSTGIIFVWIKYEGRWSIELINDRNTQVTDFSWSHDGRMALICYMDGFVLVGSVSGQRYWSSMLNLDSCTISCGIWSPDDQQVIFGTSSGHILVIDVHGTMVAQVSIQEGIAITSMSWSCEKFKMEDSDEEQRDKNQSNNDTKMFSLAVSFIDGTIYIMRNYDDLFPIIIRTGTLSTKIEWSNNGEILAVAGHKILNSTHDSSGDRSFTYQNIVQFYTVNGILRLSTTLDLIQYPITAITWGHSDKRLFIAAGPVLYIAWITKRIPSLQLLSGLAVYKCLKNEKMTEHLPLPTRLQNTVSNLFCQTLQCYLPDLAHLREFVSSPPSNNVRLHCTMIRHEEDIVGSSTTYVLYLEYLGGLVPILKGKRASKLKPEFIIFDPQFNNAEYNKNNHKNSNSYPLQNGMISPSHNANSTPYGTSSDSEIDDPLSGRSPQTRRTRRFRSRHFRSRSNESSNTSLSSSNSSNSSKRDIYVDDMPEYEKLVLVTSNIWGTKFKILGLSSWLPSQLGSINYRTSLLHLQPRQMTLAIKELGDKRTTSFSSANKYETNNNNFMSSDSEDEMAMSSMLDEGMSAPIAPMTPKKNICYSNQAVMMGQSRTISPEKRTAVQFHTSDQSSCSTNPNSEYNNFVPSLTEELLTLQINGDSQFVSMELSGPPVTTMSTSISTQTSFQSITELLNSLSTEKNTQTLFSPLIENKTLEEQTEETFSRIAKRFASELPSSYYSVNKCESLHSPAIINVNNTSANDITYYPHLASGQTISPNVSPPKGIRYKIIKKESPRKASVSCIESDLTASRSCDTTSMFPCSPKTQRRCPATLVSSTPSASSTWGAVSVLHCSNSFADTLAIDSKQILAPNIANDFKFIDDFEGEESMDSQQYSRSPSVMFQKNRSICHMQPTIGSEFTNVRTGSDNGIGHTFGNHTFQRRLTLRASKQSHSFEISETPSHSLEKTRNCMSLEEEEEDDRDYSISASPESKAAKESLAIISNSIADYTETPPKEKTVSSNSGINSNSTKCPMPSSEPLVIRNKKKATFNFDNIEMICDGPTSASIPSQSHRLKSSEALSSLKDQSTGTSDSSLPHRLHQHRASLPQAVPSTSTNSMNTSSATTIHNRSLPASPLLANQRRRKAQGKGLLYSPMMLRKVMKQKLNYLDCSSEDDNTSDDEEYEPNPDFRNLETFQKQHFRKKFKAKRRGSRVKPEIETNPKQQTVCYREFILHNKAPLWNEVSQVYQLDFGGRVTQESAKNFQIEYQGKQVMQFGRIDGNAYTLDFQYPFSALQALAVALANVTQRLK